MRHPASALLASALLALSALPLCGQARPEVLRIIAMPTAAELEDAGQPQGLIVDEDLLRAWRRLRDRAVQDGATIVVLEVTSPGGLVSTSRQFVDDLEDLRRAHSVRTVAYVPRDATSAGAVLALACGELVLAPGAAIGNIIPLQFSDTGAFREAPSKIKTEVIALLAQIARSSRFDEKILHAMVDPDSELLVVKDGQQPDELLWRAEFDRRYPNADRRVAVRTIKSTGEALKLISGGNTVGLPGFPHLQAASRDDLPRVLGLGDRPLHKEEVLHFPVPRGGFWPGIFGGVDWSIVLLVLGILFFILELKTPGLGVFGVLGILCLIGYFALNAGDGPPIALTMGLLILGFFLLLVEILILPGFGVAGIAGIGLIAFSVYAATIDLEGSTLGEQIIPDSPADWMRVQQWTIRFLGSLVLGTVGAFALAKHLHRVPFLGAAFIQVPVLRPPEGRPTAQAAPGATTATGVVDVPVGAAGITDTDLRPAGKARFPQGVVDVVSQGEWIPRGTSVRVAQVEGNRVVVIRSGGQG